jgi:hypothetical protein
MDGLGFLILGAIGFLLLFACLVWLIIIAFKESKACGFLSLLVPYYFIYYAITRWKRTKLSVFIGATGLIVFVLVVVTPMMLYKSEVTPIITGFIQAGGDKGIDNGYSFWVPDTNKDKIIQIINEHYDVFAGFQSIKITAKSWEFPWSGGTNFTCNGTIYYGNGNEINFGATLSKYNNDWKIKYIDIGDNHFIQ